MNSNLISITDMAEFFERDARTLYRWIKEDGMPGLEERGKVDFVECVRWRLQQQDLQIKALTENNETNLGIKEEQLRLMRMKANKIEMENKLKEKELIPINEAKSLYEELSLSYENSIDGFASIADKLYSLKSKEEIIDLLRKEIYNVKKRVSKHFEQ